MASAHQADLNFDLRALRRLSTPYARSSQTSKAAAERARDFVGPQGDRVMTWVAARGLQGATQKEAAAVLNIGRPSLAARFRALEQAGDILKTEERRGHCAVYRAKGHE